MNACAQLCFFLAAIAAAALKLRAPYSLSIAAAQVRSACQAHLHRCSLLHQPTQDKLTYVDGESALQKRLSVAGSYVAGLLRQAYVVFGPPRTLNGKIVGEYKLCMAYSTGRVSSDSEVSWWSR